MLVVVRHGQSLANLDNQFCGWQNSPLADAGIRDAYEAAEKIKEELARLRVNIDVCFTSILERAVHTSEIMMSVLLGDDYVLSQRDDVKIYREEGIVECHRWFSRDTGACTEGSEGFEICKCVHPSSTVIEQEGSFPLDQACAGGIKLFHCWRLNERMYGELQERNRIECVNHYGRERIEKWRRDYYVRPPPMSRDDPRHPIHHPVYRRYSGEENVPNCENLEDVEIRLSLLFENVIVPLLKQGKNVLVSCHGSTTRAIVKLMEGISVEDIVKLNIPNGVPLVYHVTNNNDKLSVRSKYYLEDEETLLLKQQAIANQIDPMHHKPTANT
eukprot:TRINITY_DN9108_c0_g1_i1.p1 TRINITY_DN9108_c0_g1~~TRINITY_DN9108_c0_g1_i1.p1  ORF type:complete len:329 (+),score=71.43 TRINITY_DN9108_c0_g1_i1:66-1052(+)